MIKKVLVKDLTIRASIKDIKDLTLRLEKVERENKRLHHENTLLKAAIAGMKAGNEDLRARLESNSHNSNKPPSGDGYKKQTIKPGLPKVKGSSQGGHQGHKGNTLQQVESPDKIVPCVPDICTCGHKFKKDQLITRYL
ncbi:MAG: DUF6444 domain-containing protein [Bacteroidales bacterium]